MTLYYPYIYLHEWLDIYSISPTNKDILVLTAERIFLMHLLRLY